MYAAILRVRFLAEEMLPVIRDNPGFRGFQVLDEGTPGELVMIDTWERREDSMAALQRPEAAAVHARYTALGLTVAAATRCTVVAQA